VSGRVGRVRSCFDAAPKPHSDHSGHWVARHSHHTAGIAADLKGDLAWAQACGAIRIAVPMPSENWHIEPSRRRESAVPPSRGQHITLHVPVHLGGRVRSQRVEHHMVRRHQFVHGTSDHDGRAGVPPVDYMSIA
jgi:hypothetical protein